MKKIIFFTCMLAQCFLLFGQNEKQKETEVRAMELIEANALLQKDIPTLQKIWATDFMVNAPINIVATGGQVELVIAGIISYTSFTRHIEEVKVLKDIVITMGSETVVPDGFDPSAGQTIQRRYTNIWMKEKGNWILVARHANNICQTVSSPVAARPSQVTEAHIDNPINFHVLKNPTQTHFIINLGNKFQKVKINITDSNGKLIERLDVANNLNTISIGENYQRGIYFAQITNGVYAKTIKLIKL